MAGKKEFKRKRHRVWEIQSQCEHDGKAIWTPEIVEKVIKKLDEEKLPDGNPSLVRWAWCMHDKDKVREENIEQLRLTDPLHEYKIGDPRPAHIHLVLQFANPIENTSLAQKVNLPINYIREPEAKKLQFEAIATYLSHCREEEQQKGKHLYPVDEIHCGNFNYTKEVAAYLAQRRKTLAKSNPRKVANDYINRIESGDLKFEDAKREIRESAEGYAFFLRYEKELRAARAEFIKRNYEMKPRINYYIFGGTGTGKSTMSKYLARALFPDYEDYECFYTVGATGVRFDDYEYQPVVIWEDIRGNDLRKEYGSEGVLNLMELNPKKRSYNIKFGRVTLTHQVNIFTAPFTFEEFIDDLMKDDTKNKKNDDVKDEEQSAEALKEQARRRFPVVINIKSSEIEVLANPRIYFNIEEKDFRKYARMENVNIALLLRDRAGKSLDNEFDKITKPIVKLHNEFMAKMSSDPKFTGEEYSSSMINVIEGYDLVAEAIRKESEEYHQCCEEFLNEHRLDDGSLGPYSSRKGWSLPKPAEYVMDVYCPFTLQQWKNMGRSVPDEDIADEGMYAEDIQDFVNQDNMKERDRLLSIREQFVEPKEADQNDEPSPPEGVSTEDLENSKYIMTDEEMAAAFANIDMDEEYSEIPEWFEEYEAQISSSTQQFLSTKAEEDFRSWCHSLFAGHLSDEIKYYSIAWNCLTENWNTVKNACIEAGIVNDELGWYRYYQEKNYNEFKI